MNKVLCFMIMLSWLGVSHALEQVKIVTVEGVPVRCLETDTGRRSNRERPEVDMQVNNRDEVHALSFGVNAIRWDQNKNVEIFLRFQPVSCLFHNGNLIKYFESPDPTDWAEAHVPTGLFDGVVARSNFIRLIKPHSDVNMNGDEHHVYFSFSKNQLFSLRQLKRLNNGHKVKKIIEVSYHFSSPSSVFRPPFRNNLLEERFPVTFGLELVFSQNKVWLHSLGHENSLRK